jgi:hypothetical protein
VFLHPIHDPVMEPGEAGHDNYVVCERIKRVLEPPNAEKTLAVRVAVA